VRVALDLGVLAHSRGGVARYVRGLAGGLGDLLRGGDRLTLVDVPASHPGAAVPEEADAVLADPPYLRVPLLRRVPLRRGWERASRPARLRRLLGATDIYHHGGTQPCSPESAVSVITLFDTSGWEHPEWHAESTLDFCAEELRMVRGGSRLLAISDWAADRAEQYLGLPAGSVGVARGAADSMFTPGRPEAGLLAGMGLSDGGYLLHVGSFVPRKNIPLLLEAYREARGRGTRLPLVMVGAEAWGGVPTPEGEGVRAVRAADDRTLLALYRGARGLLLPSRYEGLGLPVLEALACGTAVVCSSAAALPETLGGSGLLLDPDDRGAWTEAIASLEDPDHAAELTELARKAPRRTWADTARAAAAFYREVAPR